VDVNVDEDAAIDALRRSFQSRQPETQLHPPELPLWDGTGRKRQYF
jgi:hypothetical protein